jgi:hypothetical protein
MKTICTRNLQVTLVHRNEGLNVMSRRYTAALVLDDLERACLHRWSRRGHWAADESVLRRSRNTAIL